MPAQCFRLLKHSLTSTPGYDNICLAESQYVAYLYDKDYTSQLKITTAGSKTFEKTNSTYDTILGEAYTIEFSEYTW
jgi:hypothetical protein